MRWIRIEENNTVNGEVLKDAEVRIFGGKMVEKNRSCGCMRRGEETSMTACW